MTKNRRVGTLSAGISLVVFGMLYLLHLGIPAITFRLIASLWPAVLILLGIEMILAYIINKEDRMHYDAGSVILILVLAVFSICMAAAQTAMDYQWIHVY